LFLLGSLDQSGSWANYEKIVRLHPSECNKNLMFIRPIAGVISSWRRFAFGPDPTMAGWEFHSADQRHESRCWKGDAPVATLLAALTLLSGSLPWRTKFGWIRNDCKQPWGSLALCNPAAGENIA
jgi:hypothetical protein